MRSAWLEGSSGTDRVNLGELLARQARRRRWRAAVLYAVVLAATAVTVLVVATKEG